jgi:hypothetical protein
MGNDFSIVTVYWGNNENLNNFIKDAQQWTDDIVIVNIDLFGYNFKSNKAKIINVDHKFLLDNGYAQAYNLARMYAKYNWAYNLGVGKRLVTINPDINLGNSDKAAYLVREANNDKETWFKISNIHKSIMVGRIHEEPCPVLVMGKAQEFSQDVFAVWEKTGYNYTNDEEKRVCDGYRLMTRTKWLAMFDNPQNRFGPSDHWWKVYDRTEAKNIYEKIKDWYDLDKKSLVSLLSKEDFYSWKEYSI